MRVGLDFQFRHLKLELYSIASEDRSVQPLDFHSALHKLNSSSSCEQYADMLPLVFIMLSTPLSSAACESAASLHSAIKTRLCSQLKGDMVDSLMRVKALVTGEVDDSAYRGNLVDLGAVAALYNNRGDWNEKQLHNAQPAADAG